MFCDWLKTVKENVPRLQQFGNKTKTNPVFVGRVFPPLARRLVYRVAYTAKQSFFIRVKGVSPQSHSRTVYALVPDLSFEDHALRIRITDQRKSTSVLQYRRVVRVCCDWSECYLSFYYTQLKVTLNNCMHSLLTCSAAPCSRAKMAPAASWSRVLRATANGVCPERSVTFMFSSGWLSKSLMTIGCLLVMAIWIGLRLSESCKN